MRIFLLADCPPVGNTKMKSGGWSLSQLSVLPKEKKTFNLKVEVPLKVNKGNYHFVVYAGNAKLPLDVVVAQKGTYQTEIYY